MANRVTIRHRRRVQTIKPSQMRRLYFIRRYSPMSGILFLNISVDISPRLPETADIFFDHHGRLS